MSVSIVFIQRTVRNDPRYRDSSNIGRSIKYVQRVLHIVIAKPEPRKATKRGCADKYTTYPEQLEFIGCCQQAPRMYAN